jgi:hypothetical protein
LYRLFGAGKLPAAIRAELADERVLFETEGIRAVQSFSGTFPALPRTAQSSFT